MLHFGYWVALLSIIVFLKDVIQDCREKINSFSSFVSDMISGMCDSFCYKQNNECLTSYILNVQIN